MYFKKNTLFWDNFLSYHLTTRTLMPKTYKLWKWTPEGSKGRHGAEITDLKKFRVLLRNCTRKNSTERNNGDNIETIYGTNFVVIPRVPFQSLYNSNFCIFGPRYLKSIWPICMTSTPLILVLGLSDLSQLTYAAQPPFFAYIRDPLTLEIISIVFLNQF